MIQIANETRIQIQNETRRYRLTGTTPILGSNPADPEIHSRFVAAKAETIEQSLEETAMLPDADKLHEELERVKTMGLTVFLRDGDDGHIVLGQHVIKGFFKAALTTLKDQLSIAAPKSKVDNYIFIKERYIPLLRDGNPIVKPDRFLERSLRAETMQGPRVTLASSECIDAPWTIEFSVTIIGNYGTAKSKPIDFDILEAALAYGEFKGLGQWRNGGHGSFYFERI